MSDADDFIAEDLKETPEEEVAENPLEGLEQVESEQVTAVTETPRHYQAVYLHTEEYGTYEVRWDGVLFRVLKPIGVGTTEDGKTIVSYSVIGYSSPDEEVDFPFPLDFSVLERTGRVLVHTVATAGEAEED